MKLQLEIDYSPQKESFKECLHRSVYSSGKQLKYVAADLNMSPSELSRKLADNPNDPVHFPADRLPDLIRATGNLGPVFWLVNEFLRDRSKEKEQAVSQLLEMLPRIKDLIKTIETGEGA